MIDVLIATRLHGLLWLLGTFSVLLFIVCGKKGLRALVGLFISFIILAKGIVPFITQGYNPVVVTIVGGTVILLTIVYLTEGFTRGAHVAIISVLLCAALTIGLAWLFTNLTQLTGLSSEETAYVSGYGTHTIDLKELLLGGMVTGIIAALTEITVSQVITIEELNISHPDMPFRQLFVKAHRIGVSHLTSTINTLFLIYAAASFSILIIVIGGQHTWQDIVTSELLSTEIVQTFTSAMGIVISVPVSTALAIWWFRKASVSKSITAKELATKENFNKSI